MARPFAIRLVTLALAGALATALPASVRAQGTDNGAATQYHYSTTITQVYGSQYPIAGHLDLEIFPNGILRGYYHNAFQKAFIQVVGGRDGNYIWFDIGPTLVDLGLGIAPGGRLHVVATVGPDNSFRGQIYPEATAGSDTGMPGGMGDNTNGLIASNTNPQTVTDQFVFAAKPVEKSAEDYSGTY